MTLNGNNYRNKCLDFNNKTEVMVFGGTTGALLSDLGYLVQYMKARKTKLGFKLDSNLRLYSQIRAVAKSSLF